MPLPFLKDRTTYPPFIKVLIYANIYIAVCAASQVLLTQRLFGICFDLRSASYMLFILLSTYVQYNMQRGYVIAHANGSTERSQWVIRHKKTMLISNLVAVAILLCLCWELSRTSIIIMVAAEVVATLYYMPPFNLRKHGYIKPFLLGAVWTISCGLVPLIENKLLSTNAWYYLASQFCFISALCILFDVKDSVGDYMGGVNTYANRLGAPFAKVLASILIVLAAVSFWFIGQSPAAKLANTVVMVLSALLCFLSHDKKHPFFYYLYIDGLMLLQSLAVCGALLL